MQEVFEWIIGWLPSSWLSVLWGALPAGFIVNSWKDRKERLRREAAGSHLTVKDGVQRFKIEDQTVLLRWSALKVARWTQVPIELTEIRIVWPPFCRGQIRETLVEESTRRPAAPPTSVVTCSNIL